MAVATHFPLFREFFFCCLKYRPWLPSFTGRNLWKRGGLPWLTWLPLAIKCQDSLIVNLVKPFNVRVVLNSKSCAGEVWDFAVCMGNSCISWKGVDTFLPWKKHVNMLLPTFEKLAWKMTRTFVNLNVCDDIWWMEGLELGRITIEIYGSLPDWFTIGRRPLGVK